MQYTLEMLVLGRREIVDYYRTAAEKWSEIWSKSESKSLALFAKLIAREQHWFEQNCGGRFIGQEIMVVSGIVGLYSTSNGFDHNLQRARLLYDAIQSSFCSIEVKGIAEEVAKAYDL